MTSPQGHHHHHHPLLPAALAPSISSQKRRRNLVKAACNRCRIGKVKCDGKRPRCGRCSKLDGAEFCQYDVDDGETRQDALRKKSAGIQKSLSGAMGFIEALKNMTPEQAELTLANVRGTSDVHKYLEQFEDVTLSASTAPASEPALTPPDTIPPSLGINDPFIPPEPANNGRENRSDDARIHGLHSCDIISHQRITTEAVHYFFEGSSKLFHVFSRAEIQGHMELMYDPTSDDSPRVSQACVFSVAAVGCAYISPSLGKEVEDSLFDRAKLCLDDVIEYAPVTGAKVCCLLGMRLLFMKNRASLTFIEMGLELCRREGVDSQTKPFQRTEEEWIDGRKTFRTLFFFASWLSASVGYLSKCSFYMQAHGHQDINIRGETSLEDLVQSAMVKVALLKFSILRFNLDGNPLTALSMGAMSRDLKKWYDDLPPALRLLNVQDPSVPIALRRTVYFCHLLYLGCLILLARRILHSRMLPTSTLHYMEPPISSNAIVQDAITAAQQSARILDLLRKEEGIFKRCWLCIFQAYVALTMNLYAFTQQLLARDLDGARGTFLSAACCMDVLEYCSLEDSVAAQFVASCQPIYVMLGRHQRDLAPDPELRAAAQTLLDMFCMPFGADAGGKVPTIKDWTHCESEDTRLRDYSLVVSREQDFEASIPFHRTLDNLAPGPRVRTLVDSLGPSLFINPVSGRDWPNALRQG